MAALELRRNGTDEASRPSLDWSTRLAIACWGQESSVIALTFFALFSRPSPSFNPYDFTTLPLFRYPNNHSLIPFSFYPSFHTSQEQDKMAHGLLLTIHYWYMRIGIAIVGEPLADPDDPPAAPQENSGASSSPHSHDGLSDGPGPKEPRRRSPSSSDRGTDISRVQPSPRKAPLHRFSMSRAERSILLSRTLASNSLLTSLGFKKTSRLPAEETCRITTRGPTS